jgi:outer membrane receptor protein involved in Fe transport
MRTHTQANLTGAGRLALSLGRRFGDFAVGAFGLIVLDGGKSVSIQEDSETLRLRRLLQKYPNRWADMPLTSPSLVAPQPSREAQRAGEIDLNATWRDELGYQGKLLWTRRDPIVGRAFALNQGTELEQIRTLQQLGWTRRLGLGQRRLPELILDLHYHFDFQRTQNSYQDEPPGWNVGLAFYTPNWEVFPNGVLQNITLSYISNLVEAKVDAPLRLFARADSAPDFYLTLGLSFEDARVVAAQSQANFGRVLTGPNEFNYDRFQYAGGLRSAALFSNDPNKQAQLGDQPYLPSRAITAAYGQLRWDLRRWVSGVVGVRLDHYSDFGLSANPRAALLFKPRNDLFIKALYGRAFNAPSFWQLYSATPQYTVMAGKPNLKPERIDTLELQLGYQRGPLRATLTGFTFFISDLIRRISVLKDFTGEEYRFDNLLGTSTGYGGEFEAKLLLRHGLRLFANLSLQRIDYRLSATAASDVPLSAQPVLLPQVKSAAGVNWEFARHLAVDLTLVAASQRSQASRFSAGSALREYQPAPAYAFVNLALTADRLWDRLYVKLFVMDMLASGYKDYVLALPYHLLRGTPEVYLELGLRIL